ncbi:hypothetical protein E3N88_30279 [Mikania micrantha]|uniref:Uncharacterized protein n=1 Tax=Mikania micrantha TaxID=192012 RepID=A0A5N6MLV1_9ASTR|nr:hypothetical protein E3N88_30279 [Mikania micrantha]
MTAHPGSSNEIADTEDAGPSHTETDEEDETHSDFSSPESRVQKRGQIMSCSPLISNKSDPAREPENFKEAVGQKEWDKAMK